MILQEEAGCAFYINSAVDRPNILQPSIGFSVATEMNCAWNELEFTSNAGIANPEDEKGKNIIHPEPQFEGYMAQEQHVKLPEKDNGSKHNLARGNEPISAHILQKIMDYVYKKDLLICRKVNKRWARTALRLIYREWTIPSMKLFRTYIPPFGKEISSLSSAFKYVECLTVNWYQNDWDFVFLEMFIDYMPRLKVIELPIEFVSSKVVEILAKKNIGWKVAFTAPLQNGYKHSLQDAAVKRAVAQAIEIVDIQLDCRVSADMISRLTRTSLANCKKLCLFMTDIAGSPMCLLTTLKGNLPNLRYFSTMPGRSFTAPLEQTVADCLKEAEILASFLSDPQRRKLKSFNFSGETRCNA